MNHIKQYSRSEKKRFALRFSKNERACYRRGKKYGIFIGLNLQKNKKRKIFERYYKQNKIDVLAKALRSHDLNKGEVRNRSYYLKEAERLVSKK